jgi:hypothetical protein
MNHFTTVNHPIAIDHPVAIDHLTVMHHCIVIAVWLTHVGETGQQNPRMPVNLKLKNIYHVR